jgi:transposase
MAAPRKYPGEVRVRAVNLVFEWRRARGRDVGGLKEGGGQMSVNPETLRHWVRQAPGRDRQRPHATG